MKRMTPKRNDDESSVKRKASQRTIATRKLKTVMIQWGVTETKMRTNS